VLSAQDDQSQVAAQQSCALSAGVLAARYSSAVLAAMWFIRRERVLMDELRLKIMAGDSRILA
jgi:hypothetical protein